MLDGQGKPSRYSYDAWGQRRNADTWSGAPTTTADGGSDDATPRGYTGHEMLDDLGLVHMNGRIYDGLLGRFLSADILVQNPANLQCFNRYSYVMNNPLTLVDPSGFASSSLIPTPEEARAKAEDRARGDAIARHGLAGFAAGLGNAAINAAGKEAGLAAFIAGICAEFSQTAKQKNTENIAQTGPRSELKDKVETKKAPGDEVKNEKKDENPVAPDSATKTPIAGASGATLVVTSRGTTVLTPAPENAPGTYVGSAVTMTATVWGIPDSDIRISQTIVSCRGVLNQPDNGPWYDGDNGWTGDGGGGYSQEGALLEPSNTTDAQGRSVFLFYDGPGIAREPASIGIFSVAFAGTYTTEVRQISTNKVLAQQTWTVTATLDRWGRGTSTFKLGQ